MSVAQIENELNFMRQLLDLNLFKFRRVALKTSVCGTEEMRCEAYSRFERDVNFCLIGGGWIIQTTHISLSPYPQHLPIQIAPLNNYRAPPKISICGKPSVGQYSVQLGKRVSLGKADRHHLSLADIFQR